MGGDTLVALVLAILVCGCPLLTLYRPKLFGPFGVILLSAAAVFFGVAGKSAFTEITSAIFFSGAFILAAVLSPMFQGSPKAGEARERLVDERIAPRF